MFISSSFLHDRKQFSTYVNFFYMKEKYDIKHKGNMEWLSNNICVMILFLLMLFLSRNNVLCSMYFYICNRQHLFLMKHFKSINLELNFLSRRCRLFFGSFIWNMLIRLCHNSINRKIIYVEHKWAYQQKNKTPKHKFSKKKHINLKLNYFGKLIPTSKSIWNIKLELYQ